MIIHASNKCLKGLSFLLLLFLFPESTWAQKELSEKSQRKFDEYFFEGQRLKMTKEKEEAYEAFESALKIDPTNGAVNYELAIADLENYRVDLGLERALVAAQSDSSNYWYQGLLASIYDQRGEKAKKLAVLSHIVVLKPRDPSIRADYAQALLESEKYELALEQLDTLEQIVGPTVQLIEQKKNIYLYINDPNGAAREIQKLIDLDPRNVEPYGMLAQLYMNEGQPEKALEVYEALLKIDPKEPRTHLNLAEYYREKDLVEKSIYHLKIALRNPNLDMDPKVAVMLSFFKIMETNAEFVPVAEDLLDSIQLAHPNDPKIYSLQGDYYEHLENAEKAREAFVKTAKLPGGAQIEIMNRILFLDTQLGWTDSLITDAEWVQEFYPSQPLSYLLKGLAHIEKKEYSSAIVILENGLLLAYGDRAVKEQFHLYLAEAYHQTQDGPRSDENFEAALKLNPNNPTGLNNYSYYLAIRGQNLDRALECAEKANRIAPDNATFLDTWAWVLFTMKKYPEALVQMERVLILDPQSSGEVLEHYGDILYFNNNVDKALEYWEKARDSGSASPIINEKINQKKFLE